MAIVNTHYGFCAKGGAAVKFTYTGEYNVRDDGVVELLTSGTIVFLEPKVIDVFMVGGGGGGGTAPEGARSTRGTSGGGGGYTRTIKRVAINANTNYTVTIGAGGNTGANGGNTVFNLLEVPGGKYGTNTNGGNGGSGGGGGVTSNSDYGSGGYDGNNGENGSSSVTGGKGQLFTTREFGEISGKLYGGGGGGGRYMVSSTPIVSIGGSGGGGTGGWYGQGAGKYQAPSSGGPNTGGGGGGGASYTNSNYVSGASGGSGIVCFRDAQELPELAGTWVLNERLYMPERYFTENVRFTGVQTGIQGSVSFVEAQFYYARGTKRSLLRFAVSSSNIKTIYDFTENKWSERYQTITFLPSATASDEFRAWLVSNATKQS